MMYQYISDDDWESLRVSFFLEDNLPFYIEDEVFVYEEFKTQITQVRKHSIQYVCIDALLYFKLLDKSQERTTESDLHFIMFDLKRLAQQLNITIFVIPNNVDVLNEHDATDDIRTEQWQMQDGYDGVCSIVADEFLQLHCPEYYKIYEDERGNDLRGLLQIHIRKNRFGPTGYCNLRIRNTTGSVKNMEEYDLDEIKSFKMLKRQESTFACNPDNPF